MTKHDLALWIVDLTTNDAMRNVLERFAEISPDSESCSLVSHVLLKRKVSTVESVYTWKELCRLKTVILFVRKHCLEFYP